MPVASRTLLLTPESFQPFHTFHRLRSFHFSTNVRTSPIKCMHESAVYFGNI